MPKLSLHVLEYIASFVESSSDAMKMQTMSIEAYMSNMNYLYNKTHYVRERDDVKLFIRVPLAIEAVERSCPEFIQPIRDIQYWVSIQSLSRDTLSFVRPTKNDFFRDTMYLVLDAEHQTYSVNAYFTVLFGKVIVSGKPEYDMYSYIGVRGLSSSSWPIFIHAHEVKFRNMPFVTEIRGMEFNVAANVVDYSGIYNLRSFGEGFLSSVSNQHVICPNMSRIKKIPEKFIHGLFFLETIDFSGLRWITTLDNYFVSNCFILKEIKGYDFSNVVTVGSSVFSKCPMLKKLDLHQLKKLKSTGQYFIESLLGLEELILPKQSKLTKLLTKSLSGCPKIKDIDLSFLSNVKSISGVFLGNFQSLTKVDLSPLRKVTSIGADFMVKCHGITALDLRPLSNIKYIPRKFLYECMGLVTVDLSGFRNVTEIGTYFMRDCSLLVSVDLSGFVAVTTIGGYFMYGCSKCMCIDLTQMPTLKTIEEPVMLGHGMPANAIILCRQNSLTPDQLNIIGANKLLHLVP